MQVLNNAQILAWDKYTISQEPIADIDLMERASLTFVEAFVALIQQQDFLSPIISIYCGQGNNGGDGLAIARLLFEKGYEVRVILLAIKPKGTESFEINLGRVKQLNISINYLKAANDLESLAASDIIIDAMIGLGIDKPLQGLPFEVVQYLNQQVAFKVAVDLPTPYLLVHYTFTFQVLKTSLLFQETGANAGKIKVLPIGLHPAYLRTLAIGNSFFNSFSPNNFPIESQFNMKWQKGHALLVGGSYGMIGAIILSSKAAISAFCGMVSVYVPNHANSIVQTAFPEALVQTDPEENYISYIPIPENCKAIGIGPGLGRVPETQNALIDFLKRCEKPLVIDADALNLLANVFRLEPNFTLPKSCILTPHAKEFDRLFGKSENSTERLQKQRDFSKKLEVIIVLKGAYTSITDTVGNCWFNTNGHPLLATAGSGDVLTGIITSLLANGETPILAARKGVYFHSQAAQQLAQKGFKQILASNLINELPMLERIH